MEPPATRQRGRPARPATEAERTISWYWRVRELSGWSETRLETKFDERDRAGRGMHRGSRWNKYKAGITSPGEGLLAKVESAFPSSRAAFDHPLWEFLTEASLSGLALRNALGGLPQELAERLVDDGAAPSSSFWLKVEPTQNHVGALVTSWSPVTHLHRLSLLAGLVGLIRLTAIRQDEALHFACHIALARIGGLDPPTDFCEQQAWRVESLLLHRWLATEYRQEHYRTIVSELRTITTGPPVPWASPQATLTLGRSANKKEAADLRNAHGFWVAQRLLRQPVPWGSRLGPSLSPGQETRPIEQV